MKLRAIFIVKKEKTMKELPKTYEPRDVEDRLYKFWVDNGYFHAERDPDKKPFTIVMPPPNVTGQLHMGHAMDAAMQDVLIRFKRMQGYSALWIPGVDHAADLLGIRLVLLAAVGLHKGHRRDSLRLPVFAHPSAEALLPLQSLGRDHSRFLFQKRSSSQFMRFLFSIVFYHSFRPIASGDSPEASHFRFYLAPFGKV